MDEYLEALRLGEVTVIQSDDPGEAHIVDGVNRVELLSCRWIGILRHQEVGRRPPLDGHSCTVGRKKPQKVVSFIILRGMPKGVKLENLWISLSTAWE